MRKGDRTTSVLQNGGFSASLKHLCKAEHLEF